MSDRIEAQTLAPRVVKLTTRTGIDIRRTLPHRRLRMIGAWCFVDHYGPTDQKDAMSVASHPHVGLQTVSWLFSGHIEHRDSLGSRQEIFPGELNIMTAGQGISHSELSMNESSLVHGVQLWTALPDYARTIAPDFAHHQDLPSLKTDQLSITVFIGEMMGITSPAVVYSPLVGAEIDIAENSSFELPLNSDFEYGFLSVGGEISVNNSSIPFGNLCYLPAGSTTVKISSFTGAKIVLLGGSPFGEEILMWWNFIGRTHEEIEQMRHDWNSQSTRFPTFIDRIGGWIPAPDLPNVRLFPRGNV